MCFCRKTREMFYFKTVNIRFKSLLSGYFPTNKKLTMSVSLGHREGIATSSVSLCAWQTYFSDAELLPPFRSGKSLQWCQPQFTAAAHKS